MGRYSWPPSSQDEASIAGSRLAEQIRARVGLVGWALDAQVNAALAEILATTGDVLNVKSYGAIGDGVANDAVAIQLAITDAAVSGGTVFFPVGTYLVTAALTMSSNVHFLGAHRSKSIIKLGANIATALVAIGSISDVSISRLRLEGQRATFTSTANEAIGRSVAAAGGNRITIENVEIDSFAGAGVSFLATTGTHDTDISILRSRVTNTGTHGIVCQDFVDRVQIRGNYVANWGLGVADRIGIVTGRSGVDNIVADNIVEGSGSALGTSVHGISIDTSTRSTVVGNLVRGTIGFGIEVGLTVETTVVGNMVFPLTRAGIAVTGNTTDNCPQTVISGNVISGGTGQGIYVFGVSTKDQQFIVITGNNVNGGTTGIQIDWASEIVISDNYVRNCTLSGIFVGAAGATDDKVVCTGNHLADNNTDANASHGGLRVNVPTAAHTYLVRDNLVYGSGVRDYYYTEASTLISQRNVNADTTPTVALEDGYLITNSGGTTITDFDDGLEGQIITLRFADGNTTIQHGAGVIELSGAANFTPTANDSLTLRHITGVWVEVGRVAI